MGLESLSDYTPATTPHFNRVKEFMVKAGQNCPTVPIEPTEAVRVLRAKLVFEEALELIRGLGVSIKLESRDGTYTVTHPASAPVFAADGTFDLAEVVDGCADVSVVNVGTLIACGVPDAEVLRLVDENNLAKFGPGSYKREDGKHMKPPGHKKPDFAGLISRLSNP